MARRGNTGDRGMLDLPLRGEQPPSESSQAPPPDERPAPPPRPRDRRRRRPERERRRRWPLILVLLLTAAAAAFAIYRYTTPVAGFSVATLEFDQQLVGGASEPLPVTVTNSGSRSMNVAGIELAGEAADEFELTSDDCSGSVRETGESCTVTVAFKPAANGVRTATLELTGNVRGELPLVGSGAAPVLTVDRSEIDFGPQPVDGRGATRSLELSNEGAAPLTIATVAVAGDHPADFSIREECSKRPLAADGTCAVRVSFAPRAAGERAARLEVRVGDQETAATIALSGTGVWSGAPLAAEPTAIDFGSQRRGRSGGPQRAVFINRTGEPVAVGEVRLEAAAAGIAIDDQSCRRSTLAPGEECFVALSFTPEGVGKATGRLILATAAGQETVVELRGTGVEPRLEIEKTSLDFGELRTGFQKERTAVLTNSGTSTLAFRQATIGGAGASSFRKGKDGCSGFTLEPGRTCTIAISFQPSRTGTQRAELRIESDAAGGRRTIALEGRGTAAELALDARRLDFGTVQRPGSADRSVTLRNDGSARLHLHRVSVGGAAAADFVVSAIGCSEGGLEPGGSCRVTVRFAPRSDGARAARLVIEPEDAGPALEVALFGTALAARPAFRLSQSTLDFGSRPVGSRSSPDTVTVNNPGDGRLELRNISIQGAHAADFTVVPGTCDGAPYVAPGFSCTIGVRFTPRATGNRSATLRVSHNAGGDGVVELRGEGLP